MCVIRREVAEQEKAVDSEEKEPVKERKEVVHSLREGTTQGKQKHLKQTQKNMPNELNERILVEKEKKDDDDEATEEEPREVVQSQEARLHSQRTEDLPVSLKERRALVLEDVRRVTCRVLELHHEDDHC